MSDLCSEFKDGEQSKDEVLSIIFTKISNLMEDLKYLTPHGIEMKLDKILSQVISGISPDYLDSKSQLENEIMALIGIKDVDD